MSEHNISGQCLCGAVSFTVSGQINRVSACYCSQCRAQNGGGAFHGAEFAGEMVFHQDDQLKWYDSSDKARRGFCAACGSSLFWQSKTNTQYFDVSLGAFTDDSLFTLDAHIFVDSKAAYQRPPNNAPHYTESTGSLSQDAS